MQYFTILVFLHGHFLLTHYFENKSGNPEVWILTRISVIRGLCSLTVTRPD